MATFYLIGLVRIGTLILLPGRLVDEAQIDVEWLRKAGAVLWPSDDPNVAEAAERALRARLNGASELDLAIIMQDGVSRSSEGVERALTTLTGRVDDIAVPLFAPDVFEISTPGTVEFHLTHVPLDAQSVLVSVNGVAQRNGVNFTIDGDVITWLDVNYTFSVGDILSVHYRR